MTDDRLRKLTRLVGEAAPLPWRQEQYADTGRMIFSSGRRGRAVVSTNSGYGYQPNDADIAYLIAACNAVPDLIAEIARLRNEGGFE